MTEPNAIRPSKVDGARAMMRAAYDAGLTLQDLERQRDRYLAMICGPGMRFGAGGMSKNRKSMTEDIAIKLADIDADIHTEELHYLELIQQAREMIRRIPNMPYRRVLTLRYLCGMSWQQISDELHYEDSKSVFRAHGWALKALQAVINGKSP